MRGMRETKRVIRNTGLEETYVAIHCYRVSRLVFRSS